MLDKRNILFKYHAIHICAPNSCMIYISALSKLRESSVISVVRYTNMNGIVDNNGIKTCSLSCKSLFLNNNILYGLKGGKGF